MNSDAIRGGVCRPREGRGAVVSAHSTTMSSEHEQQRSRLHGEQTEQPSDEPWTDLELTIPHNRSPTAIVSLVECALVELTHEEVGAEYRSSNVFGATIDQYIAADSTGQQFRERRYDERLGWFENQINRSDVRDKLVSWLSRSTSLARNRSHPDPVTKPDTFAVKPTHQL